MSIHASPLNAPGAATPPRAGTQAGALGAQPPALQPAAKRLGWPSPRTWGVIIKDVAIVAAVMSYLADNGTNLGIPHNVVTWLSAAVYISGLLIKSFSSPPTGASSNTTAS